MTPPGTRTMKVVFPRAQLHSVEAIKTDKEGNFIEIDNDTYVPPSRGKKKYKKSSHASNYNKRGPDAEGRYKTYRLIFLGNSSEEIVNDEEAYGGFSKVKDYLKAEENGMYTMHLRHFSLSQARSRVRSNVNKVDSYIKKRRQKLILKESANLPWQGILCLIFGLVGLLLTILIGQFFEEEPRRQGGPGARRSRHNSSYRSSTSSSRRPSSRKSGVQNQKKY